jgi:hypothetical protein
MKKKYLRIIFFSIVAILILSVVSCIVMYKTFCKLEQTIDWNAVNAIIGFLMALITAVAVYIAIVVPQKDRITASKLGLFEKRFEAYTLLNKIFRNIYNNGVSPSEKLDVEDIILKTSFTIQLEDYNKIQTLYKSVCDVYAKKELDNARDVITGFREMHELVELYMIFDKYLAVRDFGIL